MSFRRIAVSALVTLALSVPAAAFAQTAPYYSQVVVTTQSAPGVSAFAGTSVVTVTATAPTMYGMNAQSSTQLSYNSNFSGDTHTVSFVPGGYSVTATNPNYYLQYSSDCSGSSSYGGLVKYCTITLTTTPPVSNICAAGWYNYGTTGCTQPVVPYQGPYYGTNLTCSPSYQTINANQTATFTAQGGTGTGYNWTTPNRTWLSIGSVLNTTFQSTGVQTVVVSNGTQSATCTVNVVSTGGAITYAGTASVITNYVSAYLPNTGFGPGNGSVFAIALVLLLSAGIFFFPYVRKALTIALS